MQMLIEGRQLLVTALKNKVNNDIIKCYYGTCYVNFTDE